MDCGSEGQNWTLPTLVAAFLDLAIAYLLLCCSAISYFAANFLYLFGLRLPCPFFHTFLLNSPPRAVAAVQVSALARFPFGRCGDEKGGLLEDLAGAVDGGGDVVDDGFSPRRPRLPPPPPPQLEWREPGRSISPQDLVQSGNPSVDTERSEFDSDCNNSEGMLLNWVNGRGKGVEKAESQRLDRSDTETIRVLERALEQEQSARSALYIELEKERNSAATAADEAMAMIERLQKEKATVDMNARQYQRMVEEKTTYDEEEMEILKEIIVRQERELHVLGKEVDVLRQAMDSSGDSLQNVGDDDDHHHLEGEPMKMLQQISDSSKESAECRTTTTDGRGTPAPELPQSSSCCDGGKGSEAHVELPVNADEDCNMEFQEKGIVSVDVYAPDVQSQIQIPKTSDVRVLDVFKPPEHGAGVDGRSPLPIDGGNDSDEQNQNHNMVEVRSRWKSTGSSCLAPEFRTLDLHVISDKSSLMNGDAFSSEDRDRDSNHGRDLPPDGYGIRSIETMSDRGSAEDQRIQRSRSDSASAHSMLGSSFDSSGSRMSSSVDGERTKLESEVEGLKERLKIIQQVRKKLNLSVEQTQKESFVLQLLHEIAAQLQEIRQLSYPTKATRRSSLPPPSSKVNSRKRRSRSDSYGHDGSS